MLGVDHDVFVTQAEELHSDSMNHRNPIEKSVALTTKKAEEGSEGIDHGIVVAADTIVVLEGEVLDKPCDREDALRHLKRLRGRRHYVYTTIVILDVDARMSVSGTGESEVTFNDVPDDLLLAYVETGEPDDKAGAYGIQGMGNFLVEKYTGQLDNIIGFPTKIFAELLEELDRKRRES